MNRMKVIEAASFGGADVLELKEVASPAPGKAMRCWSTWPRPASISSISLRALASCPPRFRRRHFGWASRWQAS